MNLNTETFGPIRRLLAVGGIVLAGSVALTGCGILEEAASDGTADTEVSGDQVDAAAEAAVGDCLPYEVLPADSSTFAVECGGADAFWTITKIEADPAVTAAGGDIADTQAIYDFCGEEVGAYLPGQAWTDWNMIYDATTGVVDYLFCIESIDQPTAEEKTPVVPTTGDCMSASDSEWYTVPCESADATATVTNAITFDTADWAAPDVDTAAAECGGTAYYELVDQFDRTNGILCFQ